VVSASYNVFSLFARRSAENDLFAKRLYVLAKLPDKRSTDEWFGRLRWIILNVLETVLLLLGVTAVAVIAWQHARSVLAPAERINAPPAGKLRKASASQRSHRARGAKPLQLKFIPHIPGLEHGPPLGHIGASGVGEEPPECAAKVESSCSRCFCPQDGHTSSDPSDRRTSFSNLVPQSWHLYS
jgi:hypothetical protein